jgi:class 3 adenylate cyclase
MSELPTGTVTFLFTDLEGSTRLSEDHPEAMEPSLARHDAILRDAVAAHDGHAVKMTGDGAHAAFADATNAVHAARDAQRALGAEDWGAVGELRVRIARAALRAAFEHFADTGDRPQLIACVNRAYECCCTPVMPTPQRSSLA